MPKECRVVLGGDMARGDMEPCFALGCQLLGSLAPTRLEPDSPSPNQGSEGARKSRINVNVYF